MKDPFETSEIPGRRALLLTLLAIAALALLGVRNPRLLAVAGVIVALVVTIMLHELGHFVTAKWAGMKVTELFVGFGPRLWSVRRGETEYGVKPLVLGGYCRIIGMTSIEDVAPPDEPRAYRSKPYRWRLLVASAGSITHFLIAIVLMFSVVFVAGDLRHARQTTTFASVGAGAKAAGLRAGDRVLRVDGTPIHTWDEMRAVVGRRAVGDRVTVVVARDDARLTRSVTLTRSDDGGPARPVVGVVSKAEVPRPGLVASVVKSPVEVGQVGWESLRALGSVFSPSGISSYFHTLAGDRAANEGTRFVSPVGFGKLASDAVRAGWVTVLGLLIAINVFVGMFNLFPLLPFDGGHIAIATYEKVASLVRRRPVRADITKLMPLTVAVLTVLGFIFVSSLFLDVTRPIANPF